MPAKKEKATREHNTEARRQRAAEHAEARQKDSALVLEALRAVLSDPSATSSQRIYAVAVLDCMQNYGFVPYKIRYPDEREPLDLSRFKAEIEKARAEQEAG